jgi:hypothetical protein
MISNHDSRELSRPYWEDNLEARQVVLDDTALHSHPPLLPHSTRRLASTAYMNLHKQLVRARVVIGRRAMPPD